MSRFPRPGRTPRPRPVPTAGPTPSPTPTPSPIGNTFNLTPSTDLASSTFASQAGIPSNFRFTGTNQLVEAAPGTIQNEDTLLDPSTTDQDVFNASLTGTAGTFVSQNVENFNLTFLAGSPLFQLDNVFGAQNVNVVGGNVAGTIDGFITGVNTPAFNITGFTNQTTLSPTSLSGLADVINIGVSGLSFGASTAVQSAIVLDSAANSGVLETVNITSNGSGINDFALSFGANESITNLNLLGSASLQARVTSGAISGVTVNGVLNTGTTTLRIDRNGEGSAVLNAANFTGVDNLLLVDSSTSGSDTANTGSIQNNQLVTFGSDFTSASISARAGSTSASFAFQNVTANTDVDLAGTTDLQNVATLNIASFGVPSASTASAGNSINSLTGDFTTINVTGDTAFDLNAAIDAPSTGTRTVVVNASGLVGNGFIDFNGANNAAVVYQVTASSAADAIQLNQSGGSIVAAAGNDTATGGSGNDTIDAGLGNDLINITAGTDILTGGLGINTFDIDSLGTAASRQVTTVASSGFNGVNSALTVTINGLAFSAPGTASNTTTAAATNFVTQNFDNILALTGVSVSASSGTLTFTGNTAGAAFTTAAQVNAAGTFSTVTPNTTTNASVGAPVVTSVTDWSDDDIINTVGVSVGADFFKGGVAGVPNSANLGVVVLNDTSYASIAAVDTALAADTNTNSAAIVYFLNASTGSVTGYYDANLATDGSGVTSTTFSFQNITTLSSLNTNFNEGNFII